MTDLWVLEWSKKQNAFHIDEAQRTVERNLNAMINDDSCDYITLCIGTRESCDAQANRFRHYLQTRMIDDMNVMQH